MEMLMYAVLGVVQGLTEFLPISSSAHLVLAEQWLRFNPPGVLLEITVHIATLVAVIIVYWKDLVKLIVERDWRYIGLLGLATVITVALILPLREFFEARTEGPYAVRLVGLELIITAMYLAVADLYLRKSREARSLSWPSAALIGLAQGIAAFPGISRSGATIGTGILLGIDRQQAARFSFMLSIPVTLGAGILSIPDVRPAVSDGLVNGAGLSLAFATSLISGIFAIYFLLWLLRHARLLYFSIYCVLLGLAALLVG